MDNDSADVAWNKNRRWKMEVGGNAVRLGNRHGIGINDVAAIGDTGAELGGEGDAQERRPGEEEFGFHRCLRFGIKIFSLGTHAIHRRGAEVGRVTP